MSGQSKPVNHPRRDPGQAFRTVGDEGGLVVVPRESKVQVLNPVGARIYAMLDGQHSREEIVRAVTEEFEVSEEQARQDLEAFLAELDAEKMLSPPELPHE